MKLRHIVFALVMSLLIVVVVLKVGFSRQDDTGPSRFVTVSLDKKSRDVLSAIDAEWVVVRESTGYFEVMQAANLNPSVATLAQWLGSESRSHSKRHPYTWLRPRNASQANLLTRTKSSRLELISIISPESTPTLRVSDDGHLAFMWIGTDTLIVFRDTPSGLQELHYAKKQLE